MDTTRRRLLQAGVATLGASCSGCSTLSSRNPLSDTVDLTDDSRKQKSVPSSPGLETEVGYGLGQIGFSYERTTASTEPSLARAVLHMGMEITPSTTLSEFDIESNEVGGHTFYPYEWVEDNDAIEDTEAYKDDFVSRLPTIRFTLVYENGGFRVVETVDTESLRANMTELIGAFVKVSGRRNNAVEQTNRGEKYIIYRNIVGERLTVETVNTTLERGRSEYEESIRLTPQDYYADTTGNGIYDALDPITVTVHQDGVSKTVLEETPTLYEVSASYSRGGSRQSHYLVSFRETVQFTPFTVVSPEGEYLSKRLHEWEIFVNEYGDVQASSEDTGNPDEYTDEISGFGASITEDRVTESGRAIPLPELSPEDRKLTRDDSFVATYAPFVEVHEDASHIDVVADFEGERYVIERVQFD